MIKACIFDLDGTLANTLESMAVIANTLMKQFGLKTLPAENFKYYSGEGADMLMRRVLIDAGDPALSHYEEGRKLYRERFNQDPLYHVQHYPGMPETIALLKRYGLKLAVCTNKPHEAARTVVETMFADDFSMILGQKDGLKRKPDPEGPLLAAEKFGVKPEECMYIGDTATDMQTGKNAGMFTVGALWGFRDRKELEENGADAIAETPEDLLDLWEE